jgi:hypothetical protein
MQIFSLGCIRIIALDSSGHPGHIVRMDVCVVRVNVRVVAVPQARLMVCVDLDERYAGADHGDDRQREYYVAGALVN